MEIARLTRREVGTHGFAKDPAYEALAGPGKRRVRGRAAQSVFAAFLLAAATSIRKIGAIYVLRNPRGRTSSHRPAAGRGTT